MVKIVGSACFRCGKPPRQRGRRDADGEDMAAGLPFPANLVVQLGSLEPLVIGYFLLIALLAVTAVFSAKPHRRKAAQDVLRILVPGRRQGPERRSRAARQRTPPQLDPPYDRSSP